MKILLIILVCITSLMAGKSQPIKLLKELGFYDHNHNGVNDGITNNEYAFYMLEIAGYCFINSKFGLAGIPCENEYKAKKDTVIIRDTVYLSEEKGWW